MLAALGSGVVQHLWLWEGWAVLLATAIVVWRGGSWWMPIVAALVINPQPYAFVAGILHSHPIGVYTAVLFTLCQLVLAFGGFGAVKLARRFR